MNKNLLYWLTKATSCMALLLAIGNINVTCAGPIHQPKVPEQLLKYKK